MNNTVTRDRVNRYITHYGATTKFIATQAGVNYTNFTLWLKGKQNFSTQNLNRINYFIDTVQKIAI